MCCCWLYVGAKTWIEELQRQGSSDIVIGLSGNKCDLESKREVSKDEAKQYSIDNNLIFFETSAKTGTIITATKQVYFVYV